jgi:hypothetical protein
MPPTVVAARPDALTHAFKVRLNEEVVTHLRTRGRIARTHGRSDYFDPSGMPWELKVPRRGDGEIWRLRREEHVRLQIDPKAAGGHREIIPEIEPRQKGDQIIISESSRVVEVPGWTVEVIWYAQHIAERGISAIIEEGYAIARRFGYVLDERIRRIDLAADVAGFEILADDWDNFVRRSRVKIYPFSKKPSGDDGFRQGDMMIREAELAALADTYAQSKIGGIRIGSGDVVARVYDKNEELKQKATPEKIEAEKTRWRAGGWDGQAPIARVEFQIRGEALSELGARRSSCVDPQTGELTNLVHYIPRLWATCMQWLRLTRPTLSKQGRPIPKTRRKIDPRWAVLRGVTWNARMDRIDPWGNVEDLKPITRVRLRGGASAAQALGAVASMVAATGALETAPIDSVLREAILEDGRLSEAPKAYVNNGKEKLFAMLSFLLSFGKDAMAEALIERWQSPDAAAIHVAIIWNSARARMRAISEKNAHRFGVRKAAPVVPASSTDAKPIEVGAPLWLPGVSVA